MKRRRDTAGVESGREEVEGEEWGGGRRSEGLFLRFRYGCTAGSKPEILSRIAQTTAALTRLKPSLE